MIRFAKIKRQSGFTLLEILIALIFVSMGVAAIIQVMGQNINNMGELERRVLASWVASNQIAEIRHKSRTDKIKSGRKTERVKMGGLNWRARATIQRTEVERVYLLTMEVYDDEAPNEAPYAAYTSAITDVL